MALLKKDQPSNVFENLNCVFLKENEIWNSNKKRSVKIFYNLNSPLNFILKNQFSQTSCPYIKINGRKYKKNY